MPCGRIFGMSTGQLTPSFLRTERSTWGENFPMLRQKETKSPRLMFTRGKLLLISHPYLVLRSILSSTTAMEAGSSAATLPRLVLLLEQIWSTCLATTPSTQIFILTPTRAFTLWHFRE